MYREETKRFLTMVTKKKNQYKIKRSDTMTVIYKTVDKK